MERERVELRHLFLTSYELGCGARPGEVWNFPGPSVPQTTNALEIAKRQSSKGG